MFDHPSSWIAAGVAVAAGLTVGAGAARQLVRRRDDADPSTALDDADERLAHLISQLKDLEQQQERLDPAAYAAEKAAFEARAAQVLREKEALTRAPKPRRSPGAARSEPSVTPAVGFLNRHPQLRGALWGGGTVGVLALLFTLVVAEQRPRGPDDTVTGGTSMGGGGGQPGGGRGLGSDPEMQELQRRLTEKPDDVPALLQLAHKLLRASMLEEAKVINDRALQLEPTSLEGLVHAAVLKAATGDTPGAVAGLDDVLKKDPKMAEAWFFRGMLGMQSGNQALMQESFKQFVTHAPDGPQKDRIRAMLESQAAGQ